MPALSLEHHLIARPRRNRHNAAIRDLVREFRVTPQDLVLPVFCCEGEGITQPVSSMPGVARHSIDQLIPLARRAFDLGVRGLALFPAINDELKNSHGTESTNLEGLLPRTIRALKDAVPGLLLISDVALDPYSSDGHDGLVVDDQIINDETLPLLAAMAVTQAQAGVDVVAPSDMMDGRVAVIRQALDQAGFQHVAICSYCVKYASSFYGPFRDALDSAPRGGDKKTYQMDPANKREALREMALDEAEGADWLMVKPGMPYLDMVAYLREHSVLPIAAYHVSGEYAMLHAAADRGMLDYHACLLETLLGFKRAGADIIFTYGALDAAELMASK